MKLAILFLILFLLPLSSANEVVGRVIFTVQNRIPSVLNITFSPQIPFPDDTLSCTPEIEDETPEKVTVTYAWKRNGLLLEEHSALLERLNAGDTISCTITPTDEEATGRAYTKTVTVETPTAAAKITKTLANTFGKDINLAQSTKLEQQGLSAITGYVVSEGVGIANILWFLIIILIVSALYLSALILMRTRKV